MGVGGFILRFFSLAIRVLQFLDSAAILVIFSYILAELSHHNLAIPQWARAVEGLSGAAALYGLLGMIFTCCLGQVTFFTVIAVILDLCFIAAMVAIAVMTRHGSNSCHGDVNTLLGSGPSDAQSVSSHVHLGLACRIEQAAFAMSVIGMYVDDPCSLFPAEPNPRQCLLLDVNLYPHRTQPPPPTRKAFWPVARKRIHFWSRTGHPFLEVKEECSPRGPDG